MPINIYLSIMMRQLFDEYIPLYLKSTLKQYNVEFPVFSGEPSTSFSERWFHSSYTPLPTT